MKYVIPSVMLSICAHAQAGEVIFHTVSIHSRKTYERTETTNNVTRDGELLYSSQSVSEKPYNNVNLGLGYRTDNGWLAGIYHNSYGNVAVYAAKEFMFTDSFGIIVGIAHGYEESTGKKVTPAASFVYKYSLDETTIANIFFTPPVKVHGGAIAHLAISKKF